MRIKSDQYYYIPICIWAFLRRCGCVQMYVGVCLRVCVDMCACVRPYGACVIHCYNIQHCLKHCQCNGIGDDIIDTPIDTTTIRFYIIDRNAWQGKH